MHNAPAAAHPSHPTVAPRRSGAPPARGQALLAALARTVRRVFPSPAAAARDHAEASAGDETAMHSPCL
jgi:hypothetical protein